MKHIHQTHHFFGPAQTSQSIINGVTGAPAWVGVALTGSAYPMWFNHEHLEAEKALFRVLWASRNTANYVQLVSCDDGPSNIVELKRLQGNGSMTPANQAIDVTAEYNALVAAGQFKNLGFRIGGDGVNQWSLMAVRLELTLKLPHCAGCQT